MSRIATTLALSLWLGFFVITAAAFASDMFDGGLLIADPALSVSLLKQAAAGASIETLPAQLMLALAAMALAAMIGKALAGLHGGPAAAARAEQLALRAVAAIAAFAAVALAAAVLQDHSPLDLAGTVVAVLATWGAVVFDIRFSADDDDISERDFQRSIDALAAGMIAQLQDPTPVGSRSTEGRRP